MGNSTSAPVYDDGHANISQHDYAVLGELRSSEIKADVINCERIYVDKLKTGDLQLCGQTKVAPPPYQAFPNRKVKVHELNVRGTIFAGHVHCDVLRAYDVFYTDELHARKTEVKDRNSVNESLTHGPMPPPPQQQQYMQPPGGFMPPQQQYMNGPPPGPPGPPPQHDFRGNFTGSSRSVHLTSPHVLEAECCDQNGQWHWSSMDLNAHITNDDGMLKWARPGETGNFAGSCQGVHLAEGGRVLAADACAVDGRFRRTMLWLDEHVGNQNGRLNYVW